jgi:hypothetical protein
MASASVLHDEAAHDPVDLILRLIRSAFVLNLVVVEVAAPDGAEEPLVMAWVRRRWRPTRRPRRVHVAGDCATRSRCRSAGARAASFVDGGVRAEDREDRVEQAQVDHLAAAALLRVRTAMTVAMAP